MSNRAVRIGGNTDPLPLPAEGRGGEEETEGKGNENRGQTERLCVLRPYMRPLCICVLRVSVCVACLSVKNRS